jgi:hypothetical protein
MKSKLLSLTVLAILSAAAQTSFAQSNGVRCPSGYEAEYENSVLKCSAVRRVYVYPAGADFGNATTPERGVRCPADSNDRVSYSGGVLKCIDVKVERRNSGCNAPWSLKVQQGQDICQLNGNNDPTIPDHGANFGVNRVGWTLVPDHSGNRDAFEKRTTSYEYPVAR